MKSGNIICTKCGYSFYFETEMESIRCLQCGEKFDTSSFPNKVEVVQELPTTSTGKDDWGIVEGTLI